jgi:hypothetical protein
MEATLFMTLAKCLLVLAVSIIGVVAVWRNIG